MHHPTDVRLLCESLEWLYRHLCKDSPRPGIRRPRNKYDDVSRACAAHSKKRKRKASCTKMLKRRLINLLETLLHQTDHLHSSYRKLLGHRADYHRRLSVIRKTLEQQKQLFEGKKEIHNRIVSIDRHYVRPIVRGKESRSVEFGAKVNNIQYLLY